ncbi:hypothetical protein [Syntrophorhabdus aromaticivorans]|uniref:hypothetical protein n=1 Tax=Syntrophorhabdus aromaticivorans TaxID=328301 RepID=UPI00048B1CAA|nr:hypothetical protein [Syntrophorhabdus aromaticivorans]
MNDHLCDYIAVSRKKREVPHDMVTVREDNRRLIRAALIHDNGEVLLVCRSTDKKIEERGIENRFGEGPDRIRQAPEKKRGTKRYDKVVEKIGQLKERNQRIARRYAITVVKNDHVVATTLIRQWKEEKHHPGVYVLRSNRTGLTEMRFFDIFSVLADIENAFQGHEVGIRTTPGRRAHNHRAYAGEKSW